MKASDLGKQFVAAVLKQGLATYNYAMARGVEPEDFVGDAMVCWKATTAFVEKYKSTPSPQAIKMQTGVELPSYDDALPVPFLLDSLLKMALQRRIATEVESLVLARKDDSDGFAFHASLGEVVNKYRRKASPVAQVYALGDVMLEAEKHYERIKKGERGVPFYWERLNRDLLGMWPEDLILFAARAGVGKTWTMVILALAAWLAGYPVLFASTEVSLVRIALRFAAVMAKLPYARFTAGTLSAEEEARFQKCIKEVRERGNYYVVGGSFNYTTDALRAAIDTVCPALVIGDGAYLFKAQGKDRNERAANAFDGLKLCAKDTGIPHLISTQLNREGAKDLAKTKSNPANGKARLDHLSLTDASGWNTDAVFSLEQTPDMQENREMLVNPLKVREGFARAFKVRWNFETMEFHELDDQDAGGSSSGEGYDTGVPVDEEPGPLDGSQVPF